MKFTAWLGGKFIRSPEIRRYRIHPTQAAVGQRKRAAGICQDRPRAAAQRLHKIPFDRYSPWTGRTVRHCQMMDLRARDWSRKFFMPRHSQIGCRLCTKAGADRLDQRVLRATGLGKAPRSGGRRRPGSHGRRVGAVRKASSLAWAPAAWCSQPNHHYRARRPAACLLSRRPRRWHLMGVMLSAAGSLRWYRDTFSHGAV
jgi:hypothetical protein